MALPNPPPAADKAALKEDRRRLAEIALAERGIPLDKKPALTKAERRAQQAQKQEQGQRQAQRPEQGQQRQAQRQPQKQEQKPPALHAPPTSANRVVPEDKRMYLYLHLDTPQHPPSSATALEVVQSLRTNNSAAADHRSGDAAAFAAGIRNAQFPPGPHVIAAMARDDYVAAIAGEPVTASISGPADALLRDAIPPFSNGLGQRKVAKLSSSLMGIAIHPRIKEVGLRMATMEISGANARVVSVLSAFSHVIADYTVPPQAALYRNLADHLSAQINFLVYQRP
ncbi:hypothetical protein GGI02_006055, partial [Coemansia sp. RSA 2322]